MTIPRGTQVTVNRAGRRSRPGKVLKMVDPDGAVQQYEVELPEHDGLKSYTDVFLETELETETPGS